MQPVSINRLFLIVGCLILLVSCAPTGVYHTVQPGQTLYRIAQTYGVNEGRLARINHIKDPNQLQVNQKIFVPWVTRLRKVPVAATTAPDTPLRTPSAPLKNNSEKTSTARTTVKHKAATKPATATAAPSKGLFIWPVKGKLLSQFGKRGQKVYKGIEIGVSKGSAVVAAASGKVIYSGNAISGYGNLVILEHSDNYFSVYGYNQRTLVKMDDHVGQGEKIALSGLPPNGESARLHFEIRKGKLAVNPILYLP